MIGLVIEDRRRVLFFQINGTIFESGELKSMKAWLLEKPGSIDDLVWTDLEGLHAGEGQLLVKTVSVSLNPVDYKRIENKEKHNGYPYVAGVDLAGIVIETGSDALGFQVGDRVACLVDLDRIGSFSEQVVVDAAAAVKIPDEVSCDQAAAILCAGMTAYEAVMQKMNTSRKRTILIQAGAGGVGGFAIQLAKELGLKVFTTASSANHSWVKSLGADVALDYRTENITECILEKTDRDGMDLILSTTGPGGATEDLKRLAFSGHLVHVAGAPDPCAVKPFTLSPSIHEVALGAAYRSNSAAAVKNLAFMANELMERVRKGTLDPIITDILPREDLPGGLKKLKDRHVRGKIVVRMDQE